MTPELQRVRWQCRRGMLELDLMLAAFLERGGYAALEAAQRGRFEQLLEFPDPILIEWLMGRERPRERDLADIADRIRDTAAS